jgi:hypothetical protein
MPTPKARRLSHLVIVLAVILVGIALWAASPIVTLIFVAWLLCATGGYVIGEPKGHGGAGILLGSFGGPLGLLIVAALGPSHATRTSREPADVETLASAEHAGSPTRTCPWCAEIIKTAALVCKHCGREVAPSSDQTTSPQLTHGS